MIRSMVLKAHFDGKVLVPDEPLPFAPNQKVRITVEPDPTPIETSPKPRRQFVTQPGVLVHMSPDFSAHLGDDFWGIEDAKPKPAGDAK
jgi:hypothetical protein